MIPVFIWDSVLLTFSITAKLNITLALFYICVQNSVGLINFTTKFNNQYNILILNTLCFQCVPQHAPEQVQLS